MHTLKNLTNSPHKIKLADGSEGRLPARGEAAFDVHPKWLPFYQRAGYLRISEGNTEEPPLPAAERDIDDLRTQYEELFGEAPDGRWGEKRLNDEINKKLAD